MVKRQLLYLLAVIIFSYEVDSQFVNHTVNFGLVRGDTTPCLHLQNKTVAVTVDIHNVFAHFEVIDVDLAFTEVADYRRIFHQRNITAVIFDYDFTLALATYILNKPFLLSTKHGNLLLQRNAFWFNQLYIDLAVATNSLLNSVLKSQKIVLIVSGNYQYLQDFTTSLQKLWIPLEIINIYETTDQAELERLMIQLKTPFAATSTFIVLLMDSEISMLKMIFDAAIMVGNMNQEQLWIIPSLFVPKDIFNPVRNTKTRFVTYSQWPIQNDPTLNSTLAAEKLLCADAVKQLLTTVGSANVRNFSLIHQMLNAQYVSDFGTFKYNASRIRVGGDILYMSPYRTIGAANDSRLHQVGTWSSTNYRAVITDTTVTRKQYVLRLAAVIEKPFFYKSHGKYSGYFVDIMSRVARENGWALQWTVASTVGVYNSTTKKWSGMMKLVTDNTVDIGVGYLVATAERRKAVDFSVSLFTFGYTTLARKGPPRFQWFFYVHPFGIWVWVSLGVVFLIQCISYFSIVQLSTLFTEGRKRNKLSFKQAIFGTFVTATVSKYPVQPKTYASRIYMIFVWFFCLVVLSSYVANFVPHLLKRETVVSPSQFFSTLLNNSEGLTWFFPEGETAIASLEGSKVAIENQLVSIASTRWPSDMVVPPSKAIEVMNKNYKRIFITDQARGTYVAKTNCNFEIGSSIVNTQYGYLAYNFKFPFKKNVNATLIRLQAVGFLDEVYKIWVSFGQPCPKVLSLNFEEMITLFLALAAGLLIGIVVALLEVLARACAICCLRLKLKKLQFGRVYKAEVNAIEMDGIRVTVDGRPNKYFLHNSQLHPDPIKNVTAQSLGMSEGSKCKVRYFGKDPITKAKYFVRDC